jgi:hypothetical protein
MTLGRWHGYQSTKWRRRDMKGAEQEFISKTHKVTITFLMEEMTGTPEESAEVLLDVYIPDECEFHVDDAWEVV